MATPNNKNNGSPSSSQPPVNPFRDNQPKSYRPHKTSFGFDAGKARYAAIILPLAIAGLILVLNVQSINIFADVVPIDISSPFYTASPSVTSPTPPTPAYRTPLPSMSPTNHSSANPTNTPATTPTINTNDSPSPQASGTIRLGLPPTPSPTTTISSPEPDFIATPGTTPQPIIDTTPEPPPMSDTCMDRGFWQTFINWVFFWRPRPTSCTPTSVPSSTPEVCALATTIDCRPAPQPDPNPGTCFDFWWWPWKCPVGVNPEPSPEITSIATPSTQPTSTPKNTSNDVIRFILDLGKRNSDVDFVNYQLIMYVYNKANNPNLIYRLATAKRQRDTQGRWYFDFKPSDFGSNNANIPTNNYCIEVSYQYKQSSSSYKDDNYRAFRYVSYTDTERATNLRGIFHYKAGSGYREVMGREFFEPNAGHHTYCPTNSPNY